MKIRNVLILILIALSLQHSIYAQEDLTILMLEGLAEMEPSLLRQKSQHLGIASDGSREELLQRLYAHYGFTESTDKQTRRSLEQKENSVELENAHYYYMNRDGESIILSGDVSLIGPSWTLTADIVLYDVKKQILTAVGTVLFTQEEREVSSSSITFSVNERDLTVLNGEILFDRRTREEEPLSLLSKGERMRFIENPAAYSASKTSVTSSIEHSYYQIEAQDAFFVTGNDVFITDATLSMGRVPILYLPFFFYPGKSLIFNPLFGFDSLKGSFITLSYELFGRNPLHTTEGEEEGTFTTFFTDDRVLSRVPGSVTYEYSDVPVSSLQKWASESGSYFSVYTDAYQVNGLHLGIDSHTVLDDKSIVADLAGGFAFMPSSFSSTSIPSTRFYIEPELSLRIPSFTLDLSFPVYSDEQVKQDYVIQERFGNFFSSFFSDDSSLTGGSRISSYSWEAETSLSLSPEVLHPFIKEIKVTSVNTSIDFVRSYDTAFSGFIISSETPLSYSATMSGQLFECSFPESAQETSRVSGYEEDRLESLARYGLSPLPATGTESEDSVRTISADLSYVLRQTGNYETEYVKGVASQENRRSVNTGILTLNEAFLPGFFTGTHSLESTYSDTSEDVERSQQYGLQYSHTVRIPAAALTHTYAQTLYHWEALVALDGTLTSESTGSEFTQDTVRTHTISFAPRLESTFFTLTPSLTYRLPPFEGKITAAVSAQSGGISALSSLEFEQEDDTYRFTYTRNSISYSNRLFSTSHTLTGRPDGLDILNSYQINSLAAVELDLLSLTGSVSALWDSDTGGFDSLIGKLGSRYGGLQFTWAHDGTDLIPSSADISLTSGELAISLWHERIAFSADLKGEFHHSFYDISGSYFMFSLNLSFDIYKFLSFDLSLTSQNRNFDRYLTLEEMIDDFFDAFDIFGNGRYTTQFVMNSLQISAIHHMDDWDLVGRYEGAVTYENNRYTWTPQVSIYLKWKAIPEINIDRELKL
ncbi:MAG: LPS-assembly protein LptD [Sphaerochaetaceae bacterium]|nr:LPS-assembly protein LptD [Sphaerochaetaceae bacterium]